MAYVTPRFSNLDFVLSLRSSLYFGCVDLLCTILNLRDESLKQRRSFSILFYSAQTWEKRARGIRRDQHRFRSVGILNQLVLIVPYVHMYNNIPFFAKSCPQKRNECILVSSQLFFEAPVSQKIDPRIVCFGAELENPVWSQSSV